MRGYGRDEEPAVLSREQILAQLRKVALEHRESLRRLSNLPDPQYSRGYLMSKRCLDLVVGIIGLISSLPLFILIALAIKLDTRGPVFYSQWRTGLGGKPFRIFKFRTMVQDAERWTGPVWTRQGDPRITTVGAFLRKTKLDELPQLWNIVRGEMSLVGPRPERPEFTEEFAAIVPAFKSRLLVKPGITGVAQLRNGADTSGYSVYRKIRYDMTYIRTASLGGDIRLILETFVAILWKRL